MNLQCPCLKVKTACHKNFEFVNSCRPPTCEKLSLPNFSSSIFKEIPIFPGGEAPLQTRPRKLQFLYQTDEFRGPRRGIQKTHTKHVNKIFTGLSRDLWGDFIYVSFPPHKKWHEKSTHKHIFGTHPNPGQSRKFVYVYVFFFWRE